MRAWCDWDQDGTISYSESVNELADHVITTMEANGTNVIAELDRMEADLKEKHAEQKQVQREKALGLSAEDEIASSAVIPPSLNQYLYDSFQNYDTDKSGTLDMSEFWPFIRSVFSNNFTDADLEELQVNISAYVSLRYLMRFFDRRHSTLMATVW